MRDFHWKVLWSTHKEGLDLLSGFPFDEVDYCIAGGMVVNGNLIKDLTILTDDPSLRYVVALEDEDIFFDPLRRVIPVARHDDLLKKYRDARALVFKRS